MPIKAWFLKIFDSLATLTIRFRPTLTVETTEKLFYIAPRAMRRVVERFASQRILACVVSGELPLIPGLNGGDAILFYPLDQCERYQIIELPDLEVQRVFGGQILVFIVPPEQRLSAYQICGYDLEGRCFSSGNLFSRGAVSATQIQKGRISITPRRVKWKTNSRNYLASFVMVHSNMQPHAAVYSHKFYWKYPQTRRLPHIVIPPDGVDLAQDEVSLLVMIVEADAWVSEILM